MSVLWTFFGPCNSFPSEFYATAQEAPPVCGAVSAIIGAGDHYQVLDCKRSATASEIRKGYLSSSVPQQGLG